ncbi:SUMO-activating enzyme subunit 1-like protein [Leptotrombidium deliense]|uniref:SUMO-activating enzyme subunit 1-like protein n=1 Tax=Leptotrombidium deliense TaxID=299467 RepID=A0A443SMJ4_9ACAR|nr:SUMO-activating enzyme subunit 1-like protein [Leptotrombidium deliense]
MSICVDSTSITSNEKDLTEDETQLYDRQIRLWGVEAQRKLRKSNVLLIGLSCVGSEITKNLVLCGLKSLTIIDDKVVNKYNSLSHLFTRQTLGENRGKVSESHIRALNPMVDILTHDWDVEKMIEDNDEKLIQLLKSVDVVCITNYGAETIQKLNVLYRSVNSDEVKFYAVCNWGFYAFSFTDLGKLHQYGVEEMNQKEVELEEPHKKKLKSLEHDKSFVEKTLTYSSFENFLSVKAGKSGIGITKRTNPCVILAHVMFKFYSKHHRYPSPNSRDDDINDLKVLQKAVTEELRVDSSWMSKLDDDKWWEHVYEEISPVSAIVGGVIGQDIIRAISAQDTPIKNVFVFNGIQCTGFIESIGK